MGNRSLENHWVEGKSREKNLAQTHVWECRCVYLQLHSRVWICAFLYIEDICHILQSAITSQRHRQDSWQSHTSHDLADSKPYCRVHAARTGEWGAIHVINSNKFSSQAAPVWHASLTEPTTYTLRPFSGKFGKTSGINMYASNFIIMLVYESYSTYKKPFA